MTAPILVLLYDRIYLAGSFRQLARQRWGLYAGLAATWGVLATSIQAALFTTETWAGFGLRGLSPWQYLRSQPGVLLHYLQLSFWPRSLCLDYCWPVASWPEAIGPGLVVLLLLGLTLLALWRWPRLGFLGAWFFVILAPTSSILPINDLAFEHRMYLSLAAVVLLAVLGLDALLDRLAAWD